MEYEIYFLASSLQMLPVVIWLVHLKKTTTKQTKNQSRRKRAEQNEKALPN